MLAGHVLGYRLVFHGPQRHAILLETGHGYLSIAIRVAAAAAVIAFAATLAGGYARAKAGGLTGPDPRTTIARLSLLQICAFVGLEFVERLVSGVPLHHFLVPVLVVGAIAQIGIAAVGAVLIVLLYRAGAGAARRVVPPCAAASPTTWIPVRLLVASRCRPDSPRPIRGPPALLLRTR